MCGNDKRSSLKSLQVKRRKLQDEINQHSRDVSQGQRKLAIMKRELESLNKSIDNVSKKGIVVTEHAILRYFQRVLGFDTNAIAKKIISDKAKGFIEELGDGKYPSGDLMIVVKNNCVVSLMKQDE